MIWLAKITVCCLASSPIISVWRSAYCAQRGKPRQSHSAIYSCPCMSRLSRRPRPSPALQPMSGMAMARSGCAEGPRLRLSGIAARELDGSCSRGQFCTDRERGKRRSQEWCGQAFFQERQNAPHERAMQRLSGSGQGLDHVIEGHVCWVDGRA